MCLFGGLFECLRVKINNVPGEIYTVFVVKEIYSYVTNGETDKSSCHFVEMFIVYSLVLNGLPTNLFARWSTNVSRQKEAEVYGIIASCRSQFKPANIFCFQVSSQALEGCTMINDSFPQSTPTENFDSDINCPEEEPYTSQKRFVRTSLYLVAMVMSLFGNVIIIWIVRKNRRMRNLTHYLIVNMAVADLLVTVLHMPYRLQIQLTNSHALVVGGLTGNLICKLVGYSQDVSIASSVFTLMGISVDSFMAVVFPLKRAALNHKVRYVLAPIWIMSIAICSPLLYVNKMYEGQFYCYEEWAPLLDSGTAGRYNLDCFTL